jgi:pimeloyl-ACP methyl ester carboxylesterase
MIKAKYNANDKAVVVFGGSYGGMLAAWLRMKFPATFQGALAASAPILQFQGAASEDEYYNIINADFAGVFPDDQRCSKGIREAFGYLMDLKTRTADWPEVSTLLNTCNVIDTADKLDSLYQHYMAGFEYMAMTDYPYESAFLQPMPAWPVNVSCEAFKDIPLPTEPQVEGKTLGKLSDRERLVLTALNTSSNVYYNFKNQ